MAGPLPLTTKNVYIYVYIFGRPKATKKMFKPPCFFCFFFIKFVCVRFSVPQRHIINQSLLRSHCSSPNVCMLSSPPKDFYFECLFLSTSVPYQPTPVTHSQVPKGPKQSALTQQSCVYALNLTREEIQCLLYAEVIK